MTCVSPLTAFRSVLSEPEFIGIAAGIVLQGYLPESHAALEELIALGEKSF